ncbi:uncharacterized protein LOC141885778 [Acropora palmata]|uniref:uncharacterized protein LOC141885778 n=1 Tax=Acropora palmata TaxID=6131 RepID=UPI003DA1C138
MQGDFSWSDRWEKKYIKLLSLDANKPERRTRRDDCISESLTFFIQGFNKSVRRTRMYYCISNSSSSQDSSQANEEVKNRNCKSDSMKGFFRRFFVSTKRSPSLCLEKH